MNKVMRTSTRLTLSALLSVAVSVAISMLLKAIITAALKSNDGAQEVTATGGPPRPPRGTNINPVAVLVFMPILVGNSSNRFMSHSRSYIGGKRKR